MAIIRYANQVGSRAHVECMHTVKPGDMEYQVCVGGGSASVHAIHSTQELLGWWMGRKGCILLSYRGSVWTPARPYHLTPISLHTHTPHTFQVESTFLSYCYRTGGSRSPMYGPIAASGSNAAILHYGKREGRTLCPALMRTSSCPGSASIQP